VSSDGKVLSRNELADQSATAAAALAELRRLGPADVVPLAQDLERRVGRSVAVTSSVRCWHCTKRSGGRSGARQFVFLLRANFVA